MGLVGQMLKPSREKSVAQGEEHTTRGELITWRGLYHTGRSIIGEGSIVHEESISHDEEHEESRLHGEEHITRGGAYYTGRGIVTTRTRGGGYYIEDITLYEERNAETITPHVEGSHQSIETKKRKKKEKGGGKFTDFRRENRSIKVAPITDFSLQP